MTCFELFGVIDWLGRALLEMEELVPYFLWLIWHHFDKRGDAGADSLHSPFGDQCLNRRHLLLLPLKWIER